MKNSLVFSWVDELSKFLSQHSVDISLYGKGGTKDLEDLYSELSQWEAELSFDKKTQRVIRRVKVLNVDIFWRDKVLFEEKQVFKDTDGNETENMRVRDHLRVAVSEKIWPKEDVSSWIMRAVKEELGIILGNQQLSKGIEEETESRESLSFPHVWTIYQVITSSVILNDSQYDPDWYVETQKKKNTYFKWKDKSGAF